MILCKTFCRNHFICYNFGLEVQLKHSIFLCDIIRSILLNYKLHKWSHNLFVITTKFLTFSSDLKFFVLTCLFPFSSDLPLINLFEHTSELRIFQKFGWKCPNAFQCFISHPDLQNKSSGKKILNTTFYPD